MEELNLKRNDNNEVVVVTQVEQETPISSEELERQIEQHETILANLKETLKQVKAFEKEPSNGHI